MSERWEPTPVPLGDGRHDIGDDTRAAIFHRLHDDFTLAAPWMTAEQRRQLAMLSAASVRALLHELGTLKDLSLLSSARPGAGEPSGWQPIATAPKDEDWLLLWAEDEGVHPGYWDDKHGWLAVETQHLTGGKMKPTHWQHMPDPLASPRPIPPRRSPRRRRRCRRGCTGLKNKRLHVKRRRVNVAK